MSGKIVDDFLFMSEVMVVRGQGGDGGSSVGRWGG